VGCTQAEILRLLTLIEKRVILAAKDMQDLKRRWQVLKASIEEKSLEELESQLGVFV